MLQVFYRQKEELTSLPAGAFHEHEVCSLKETDIYITLKYVIELSAADRCLIDSPEG